MRKHLGILADFWSKHGTGLSSSISVSSMFGADEGLLASGCLGVARELARFDWQLADGEALRKKSWCQARQVLEVIKGSEQSFKGMISPTTLRACLDAADLGFECRTFVHGANASARKVVPAAFALVGVEHLKIDSLAEALAHENSSYASSDARATPARVAEAAIELVAAELGTTPCTSDDPRLSAPFLKRLVRFLIGEETPDSTTFEVVAPFVMVELDANQKHLGAKLMQFRFTRMASRAPHGKPTVVLNPRQALLWMESDFGKALFEIVPARMAEPTQSPGPPRADFTAEVCVSIEEVGRDRKTPLGVRRLEGKSAGGAALRGLYFCLAGWCEDADLIVFATVDDGGELGEVDPDGVRTKMAEICRKYRDRITTFVVAGDGNEDAVRAALMEHGLRPSDFKIKNLCRGS